MKKIYIRLSQASIVILRSIILCFFVIIFMSACNSKQDKLPIIVAEQNNNHLADSSASEPDSADLKEEVLSSEVVNFIDEAGSTLETRIHTPEGFTRIPSISKELTGFLRELTLKEAGSEVLLYNGLPKDNQDGHVAVFDLDTGSRDLQQCADSILRIYAEYYWSIGAYDKIAFHLTNGFLMEYTKWQGGNRIVVNGNDVRWIKTEIFDSSYEEFRRYLTMVFAYAGTLSLSKECEGIALEQMRPGDMFLQSGSPGHCVLVVDTAQDKDGNQCFLLAQGFMPAQDFHVLKNPLHPEDPWYYASEITFPLSTPSWTFDEGSLVRWDSFPLNEAGSPLVFTEQNQVKQSFSDTDTDTIPAMGGEIVTPTGEPATTVTLLAVGDNLIHIQVVNSGKQADGTYNYDHLYANIKEEISEADIAVINQETIFGGDQFAFSGYPNFNSPTEIGDAVIGAGFDVVLQATNHTMDMGTSGIENTISFWKQHPQITVLGINESEEARQKIPIIDKNGIKIAMLNYTYSLNGYTLPKDKPYLVNMLVKERMAEDIKMAEELADFTVVFPHWGTEYVYKATNAQEELTEFFYEQGVDLVLGSHPHVLEPVKWIEGTAGHRMLVYYSLGNFISYQREAPRMLGGIAKVTITKDETGTYISDASITPIVTQYENGPADYNYAIYKLSDYSQELADRHSVNALAQQGPFTYQETLDLAEQVLGSWYR